MSEFDGNSAGRSQFRPGGLGYERSLLLAFFGIFVPLCLFGWLASAVSNQRSLGWEATILRSLPASTTPGLDGIIGVLAESGGISVVVVLSVLGVLALKEVARLREALFVTVAVVGVVILSLLVRCAVQRSQLAWAGSATASFDFGFPSTQAADTFAVVLAGVVVCWGTRWRWLAVTLGVLYVVGVGLARTYLGLHYPSDVLAGWVLSLAWVTAASFVRRLPVRL
jgi:undecaprenyl-diphosphatase